MVARFMDISIIFLDRDSHLHCQTIEEKYGRLFCSRVQSCTGKSYMSILSLFSFSVIFAGARFVAIQKFCYHGKVTLRLPLYSEGNFS